MAKPSETLKRMREIIGAGFISRQGLAADQAFALAADAVASIQEEYRGDAIYIGVGRAELEEKRNWLIWEQFNGSNHAELGRRFSGWNGLGSLTERMVYKIIERLRPIAIGKVQGNLFEDMSEEAL